MRTVRIGIYDEERDYVEKLSAYLGKRGKGRWMVSAYTSDDLLQRDAKGFDLISATDRRVLHKIRQEHKTAVLWIKEEEDANAGLPSVYRYQSAAVIAEAMEEIVNTMAADTRIPAAAIYSPVGRCGKTALALELVRQGRYGRWFYVGMEDYSSLWRKNAVSSDGFLYHVKERNEEPVFSLIRESGGILPSAFSPFDTKCLTAEDMEWLLERLQKMEGYAGIVFDLGTGVLSEISILMQFDFIVVPYLREGTEKLEQFQALINACGMNRIEGQLIYVDMENEGEREMALKRIGGGRWEM